MRLCVCVHAQKKSEIKFHDRAHRTPQIICQSFPPFLSWILRPEFSNNYHYFVPTPWRSLNPPLAHDPHSLHGTGAVASRGRFAVPLVAATAWLVLASSLWKFADKDGGPLLRFSFANFLAQTKNYMVFIRFRVYFNKSHINKQNSWKNLVVCI